MFLPGTEEEPGFARRESDGGIGLDCSPTHVAGQAVDARRDVDRQHRHFQSGGRIEGAAQSRTHTGIDHQIGAVPRRPVRRKDLAAHTELFELGGRHPTVFAVVALASEDDDSPTVGAAQHLDRRGRDGPSRPLDQLADRFRSGRIHCCHLRWGEHGFHPVSMGILEAVTLDSVGQKPRVWYGVRACGRGRR